MEEIIEYCKRHECNSECDFYVNATDGCAWSKTEVRLIKTCPNCKHDTFIQEDEDNYICTNCDSMWGCWELDDVYEIKVKRGDNNYGR